MIKFFKKMLSNSQEVSSRRFIALILLPSYVIGILIGVFSKNFNFYLVAMIAAGIPIFIAYFTLTWETVKELLNTQAFKKRDGLYDGSDDSQLKDP